MNPLLWPLYARVAALLVVAIVAMFIYEYRHEPPGPQKPGVIQRKQKMVYDGRSPSQRERLRR